MTFSIPDKTGEVAIRLGHGPFTRRETPMAYSNSANLQTAEETVAALDKSIAGLRTTLTRAKTFRRQLRKITGTPQDGSVVKAVRQMKARLDYLEARESQYQALGAALRSIAA